MVSAYSLAQFESEVPACAHVLSQIRLATQHRDPVLIFGETGTGKRTAARVIHQSSSQAERSMLRISAAALPESALRDLVDLTSDHRFGTISLEDPASLPRDLQQQLHQQLSAGNSHSRWITLNQRPLEVEVAAGRMISDLCYSLGVQSIRLLPLRERIDDLARLALSLVRRWPEMSQLVPQFSDAAMVLLRAHSWPGNLRELEEVLKAALTASEGKVVQVEHLPVKLRRSSEELPVSKPQSWRLDQLLESVERRMIQLALTKSKGNKTVAAELLGIWRPRFLRRMDALGIAAETQSDFQENDDDAPSTDRGA
jgi:DNA-binding NtrC family response regulator